MTQKYVQIHDGDNTISCAENSHSWRNFFDFMPLYSDSWREKISWPEFEFMTTKKCSWREIMMVHDGIENSWRENFFHDENFSNSWRRIKFMTEKGSTWCLQLSWVLLCGLYTRDNLCIARKDEQKCSGAAEPENYVCKRSLNAAEKCVVAL